MIRQVCIDEFGANDLLIVSNMDFGHTDPQLILPLGCEVELDPTAKQMVLREYPYMP